MTWDRLALKRRRRSSKYYNDKDFIKLKNKWDDKLDKSLRKDGLRDVEVWDKSTGDAFERMHGISQADVLATYSVEQEEYYRMATTFVWELRRRRAGRRAIRIWGYHADGWSYRRIARHMHISKGVVERTVKRWRDEMLDTMGESSG